MKKPTILTGSGQKKGDPKVPSGPLDFLAVSDLKSWKDNITSIQKAANACESRTKKDILNLGKLAHELIESLDSYQTDGKKPSRGKFLNTHFKQTRNRIDEAIAANRAIQNGTPDDCQLTVLIRLGQKLGNVKAPHEAEAVRKAIADGSISSGPNSYSLITSPANILVRAIGAIGKPPALKQTPEGILKEVKENLATAITEAISAASSLKLDETLQADFAVHVSEILEISKRFAGEFRVAIYSEGHEPSDVVPIQTELAHVTH